MTRDRDSADKGAHRNAIQPGRCVHWYRIDAVLGQGGFGITYLAHDANLDEPVAIKEYLPADLAVRESDCSVNPLSESHGEKYRDGMQRFIGEARTLSRFRHPNIVRVRSVFEANNTAYMVMDYEDGETLHQVVAREAPIPESKLRAILEPILSGLEQVHRAGFVHRDIKPANIFIRRDGTPLLLDFGSARQAVGMQTRTLTTLISPGYAPFEQYFSKSRAQGPWTDIYALAATLYKAIAGRPPLSAVDRSECMLKSVPDCFVPISEIGAGHYSRQFLAAIDRALSFRAEQRPQSVNEWRREFDGAVAAPAASPASEEPTVAASVGPASCRPECMYGRVNLAPKYRHKRAAPSDKLPATSTSALDNKGQTFSFDPYARRTRWYALFHGAAILAALINLGLLGYIVKMAG
ncbi:MAG: serine/threonine protein kinase [Gammaproteobacteria bacterium]|nr:serine/threonine protein kinase [Gammaproteobacteria bacterium]